MKVNVIEHDKKKNTHFILIADLHEKHLDRKCLDITLQYARIHLIKNCIILGDFLDLEYLMPKNHEFKKWIGRNDAIEEFFLPKWEESCLWANTILDELQQVFKKIYYLKGNHSQRVDYFRDEFCLAEYRHHFDLKEKIGAAKRGIEVYEYNDYLDVGSVCLHHGMYHSPSHFKNHFLSAEGMSVIVGHLHRYERMAFVSRGKSKSVTSLPCMCHKNPQYMKNKDNSWDNGFGHLIVKPNSHFNLNVFCIWDDELCLPDGRILK